VPRVNAFKFLNKMIALALLLSFLAGCGRAGLSRQDIATLRSLKQIDDFPLYTMVYQGSYEEVASAAIAPDTSLANLLPVERSLPTPAWACSLFAALGDPERMLYGRNFDWQFSPALLLFTDPPGGYASVSMVDLAYFGFDGEQSRGLADLPLRKRRALLDAPRMPFDGMNERGLVVGMAAVPPGGMRADPGKGTVGSIQVIREMLDHAADVDEALALLDRYNIDFGGGPPIHYLIADRSGRAVLVEFYQGQRHLFYSDGPWHRATNFLRASVDDPSGQCRRYDALDRRLAQSAGRLSGQEAMDLLSQVAQGNTQWSAVYDLSAGSVTVALGRDYQDLYTFALEEAGKLGN
jgi:hypothetical protein